MAPPPWAPRSVTASTMSAASVSLPAVALAAALAAAAAAAAAPAAKVDDGLPAAAQDAHGVWEGGGGRGGEDRQGRGQRGRGGEEGGEEARGGGGGGGRGEPVQGEARGGYGRGGSWVGRKARRVAAAAAADAPSSPPLRSPSSLFSLPPPQLHVQRDEKKTKETDCTAYGERSSPRAAGSPKERTSARTLNVPHLGPPVVEYAVQYELSKRARPSRSNPAWVPPLS